MSFIVMLTKPIYIFQYKKPQQLLDMEKEWFQEVSKVNSIKDVPNDCKAQ